MTTEVRGVSEQASQASPTQRDFSARLVLALAKKPGNLFVSPYSVWALLAMLHPGARGETREVLKQVLGIDEATTVGDRLERIRKLIVANALWAQQGYRLEPDYVQEVRNRFKAKIAELDLTGNRGAACDTINAWADEKTRGRISQIISPGEIGPLTRLILANATYFKDDWHFQFEREDTREKPFHRLDASEVDVQMMHQETRFPYFETRGLQAVRLLYRHSGLSMTVLLPEQIREFEAGLTSEYVDRLLEGPFELERVYLGLPRYCSRDEHQLAPVLETLGLEPLFDDRADLSGISTEPGAHVDQVKQVTFVEIDEEGTEAAAVTTTMFIQVGSPMLEPEPKVMIVDRPYWFFIRDDKTGLMLFAGRVEDPS